jgi:hypothetical protein
MTPHVERHFTGDALRGLASGMGKDCPSAKFGNH